MTEFLSCAICQAPATKQCSGCKNEYYCDKECQALGWEYEDHDSVCGNAQPIEARHGQGRGHKEHHEYKKAKWTHMAKESKWTPKQRRYFWYRASIAPE